MKVILKRKQPKKTAFLDSVFFQSRANFAVCLKLFIEDEANGRFVYS